MVSIIASGLTSWLVLVPAARQAQLSVERFTEDVLAYLYISIDMPLSTQSVLENPLAGVTDPFTDEDVELVRQLDGVVAVYPELRLTAIITFRDLNITVINPDTGEVTTISEIKEYFDLIVVEVDYLEDMPFYRSLIEGRYPDRGAYEVMASKHFEGISFNDEAEIQLGPETFKMEVVGIFLPPRIQHSMVTSRETVDNMLGELPIPENAYTSMWVKVGSLEDVELVAELIDEALPKALVSYDAAAVKSAIELVNVAQSHYALIGYSLLILASAGLVLVRVLDVTKHKWEIGLLKTMGWSSSNVFKYVLYYSLYIGVLGFILGIALSILLANFTPMFSIKMPFSPEAVKILPKLDMYQMAFALPLSLAISTAAGWAGALYCIRLSLENALRSQ